MNEEPLNSQIEPSMDESFLLKIREIVLKNLSNENFSIDLLIKEVGISRSQVHRKLKRITGKSVSHFICEIRLEEALKLLNGNVATSAEIAYRVGFSSPNYFIKCFRDHYGITPGEVLKMEAPFEISPGVEKKHIHKNSWKRRKVSAFISLLIIIVIVVYYIIGSLKQSSDISKLENSIAVLPFENWNSDEEYSYLGDAITDEIILELQKIKEFDRVLSRSSTMQYKENRPSIPEMADKLGVNYIIEGSIQRQGDDVRIIVKVFRAKNERQIWAREYGGQWTDIYEIQDNIAKKIASELKVVLSQEEIEQIEKRPTEDLEAYNLYLKGRFFWDKRTEESQKNSVKCFNKSVEMDPDYALAYAGLADAYFILSWYTWYPSPDGFIKAKEFALRALKLDNNLAEAHATLGAIMSWHEWRWKDGEKELLLAISLNPNYANAHQYYSELLDITGHNEGARVQINMALELDPFNFVYLTLSALYYYHEGKLQESLDAWMKKQELWPDNKRHAIKNFYSYIRMGEDLKAVEAIIKIKPSDTLTIKEVYNKSGINGILNWMIETNLKNPNPSPYIPNPSPYMLAKLYAIQNQKEEALKCLEKALEVRTPDLPRINNDPVYDILRNDPRFLKIVDEIGLTPYHKRKAK